MKEPLKRFIQNLGEAINDSLSESDRIGDAIGELRQAGYDIFLVLEATIGYVKRDDSKEEKENTPEDTKATNSEPPKIKFTIQDKRFAKLLGIKDPSNEE